MSSDVANIIENKIRRVCVCKFRDFISKKALPQNPRKYHFFSILRVYHHMKRPDLKMGVQSKVRVQLEGPVKIWQGARKKYGDHIIVHCR